MLSSPRVLVASPLSPPRGVVNDLYTISTKRKLNVAPYLKKYLHSKMKFTMVSTMTAKGMNSKQVQQAGTNERGVHFGVVAERVYPPGLVVNPGGSGRFSLSIGLTGRYTQRESVSLTDYEAGKTLDETASNWGYANISTSTSRGPMCAPRDRQLRDERGRFDFLRKRGFTPLEMEEVYDSNRQTLDDRHESKKDVEARDWARASKFKANQSPGALAGKSDADWANSMWRDIHVDLCPGAPQKKKPKYKELILEAASFDGTAATKMLFQATCPGAPKKKKPESTECIHEAAAFGGTAQLLFLALPSPDNHVSITITPTPMPAEVPAKAGRRGVVKRIIASGIYTTTLATLGGLVHAFGGDIYEYAPAAIFPTAVMLVAVFS